MKKIFKGKESDKTMRGIASAATTLIIGLMMIATACSAEGVGDYLNESQIRESSGDSYVRIWDDQQGTSYRASAKTNQIMQIDLSKNHLTYLNVTVGDQFQGYVDGCVSQHQWMHDGIQYFTYKDKEGHVIRVATKNLVVYQITIFLGEL